MNVSLMPELETIVNHQVKSGHFTSASEVVRHALRETYLHGQPQFGPHLEKRLQEAMSSGTAPLTSNTFKRIRVAHQKNLNALKKLQAV